MAGKLAEQLGHFVIEGSLGGLGRSRLRVFPQRKFQLFHQFVVNLVALGGWLRCGR